MAKLSLVLLLVALLAPGAAQAQRKSGKRNKPTAAKVKRAKLRRAKKHFANARDHHEHKEYLAAAEQYEKAYELFPNPEFLFNAAQVYRLAGKKQLAMDRYDQYLELDPDGRGAPDARSHRAELANELAEEKRQAELAAQREQEAQQAAVRDSQEASGEPSRQQESEPQQVPEQALSSAGEPATDSGGSLRIAGMVSGGVGIVALGLGVKFGLDAKGYNDDVESNTVWDQSAYDSGEAAERNMYLAYGVGAAAVVAGGVLYWLGQPAGSSSAGSERQVSVVATPTRGGGAVFLRGAF